MQDLRIALVQSDIAWESVPVNLEKFDGKLETLRGLSDLIVLPEMFTTGFSMSPDALAEGMDGETVNWLKYQSEKADAAIIGSVIISEDNNFYNRLLCVQPDDKIFNYDKKHLFSMAGEEKIYKPGNKKLIINWKGWRICPMICYDLRFPVWVRNRDEYDLLIFVASWPDRRIEHWRSLLLARAIENQCYVMGVNRVGTDGNDVLYNGNSMVVSPAGDILWEAAKIETNGVLSLSYDDITRVRRYMPFLNDRDDFRLES
ncbi:MAG: amidohydrolase [Bacteroidota bacterium]|nr:amidohydrolase [Bacteroidota bacterium]